MRCPDCNKFVGLETGEPEADLSVEAAEDNKSAQITGTVRLVRCCAECGGEMKETTFDVDEQVDLSGEQIDERAEVVAAEIEVTNIESTESGGGRYKKNMIGYNLTYTVSVPWKLGKEEGAAEIEGNLADAAQASAFDEMV
jgi:hypothetical protein